MDNQHNQAWQQWHNNALMTVNSETDAPPWWKQNIPRVFTDFPVDHTAWSLTALRHKGNYPVEVQKGRTTNKNYEIQAPAHKAIMPFQEFLDEIEHGVDNDVYMTAQNTNVNLRQNLQSLYPNLLEFGIQPGQFGEFLWIGKGTRTPLHHDLAQILMVQLHGTKIIHLIAPQYQPQMENKSGLGVHSGLCWLEDKTVAENLGIKMETITLESGWVLFLPIGWWHQVEAPGYSATATFTNFKWQNNFTAGFPP